MEMEQVDGDAENRERGSKRWMMVIFITEEKWDGDGVGHVLPDQRTRKVSVGVEF